MEHTEHSDRGTQDSGHQDDNPRLPQGDVVIVDSGSEIVSNLNLSFSCVHDGHPFEDRRYR